MKLELLIIGGIIFLFILAFRKFKGLKDNWTLIIFILFLAFLYLTMSSMMEKGEIKLDSPKTLVNSIGVYFGWLGQTTIEIFSIGKDSVKTIGNVITNTTKKED